MSGKRLALALAIVYMSWTSAAYAAEIRVTPDSGYESEISAGSARHQPDYRDSIMSYLFVSMRDSEISAVQKANRSEIESPEQSILTKWKEKQADRWKHLPQGKFEINASAYTAAADECGKSDGITASGLKVEANRTLACPVNFPFGAKIAIDGYGTFECEDRGGAIKGNHFDIYMPTKQEAFAFGRRHLSAEVVMD